MLAACLVALSLAPAAQADVAPPPPDDTRGVVAAVGGGVAFEHLLVQHLALAGWGGLAPVSTPVATLAVGPELALELRAMLSESWFLGVYATAWGMGAPDSTGVLPFAAFVPGLRLALRIDPHAPATFEPFLGVGMPAYRVFSTDCCGAASTSGNFENPVFMLGMRALLFPQHH